MRCFGISSYSVLLAHFSLAAVLFFASLTREVDSSENVLASESASSTSKARASSRTKRAPGWGKRSIVNENPSESDDWQALMDWGKRFAESEDSFEEQKRAPGWGKRAPGWGKRAPGWGKRSTWQEKIAQSKRFAESADSFEEEKRAPGWGKRAPGWGKRAPGWGKRSLSSTCMRLEKAVDILLAQALEAHNRQVAVCGSPSRPNEFQRK